MNPYTRPPPVTASPANSEQTNPTRTNNPRDRDVQHLRNVSPTTQNSGSSEDFANARQDQNQENNPAAQMQRLNQVIQNFHTKAALIILHSRVELNPAYSKNTDTKRINRWFNIELDESDDYREEIKRWKTCDLNHDRPPPLVIEVFLTTEQLQQGQRLVILDEDGKRWELTNPVSSTQSRGGQRSSAESNEILLERWTIELGDTSTGLAADLTTVLPLVYKKSIVLFRSLFTYCNFLPAWKLSRKLGRGRSYLAMKLGYRIVDGSRLSKLNRPDKLQTPLYDSTSEVLADYSFGVTDSPAGPFSVSVKYRQNCDFRIDDSEELLSSRFWGTDEDLFPPSVSEDRQKDRSGAVEIGSLPTDTRRNLLKRPELGHAYGSLSTFHEAGIGMGTSPISALRNAQEFTVASSSPPPAEPRAPPALTQTSGSASTSKTSLLAAAAGRRSSFSYQPFKAPTLSASPLASSPLASSPRNYSGRVPVLGSLTEEIGLPQTAGPTARRLTSDAGVNIPSTSSSPKPGKYSSSFTHRRARLSTGGTVSRTDEDQTSSGRGSAASSAQPGSGLMAEAATTGTSSGSMQEDDNANISDFLKMLDTKKEPVAPNTASGVEAATRRTAAALNRFHRMRDSNAALSDSMSSSLMLHRSSSSSSRQLSSVPPMVGPTSFSTSSSPGKPISPHTPHTPFAPSRLSAAYSNDDTDEQSRVPGMMEPTSPSDIGTSSTVQGQSLAQIGAIPIPNSPRITLPGYQRSSSAQRRPMISEEELDMDGIRSASMGAHDRRASQRDPSATSGTRDSIQSRDRSQLSPDSSPRTERQSENALSPTDANSRQAMGRYAARNARGLTGRNIRTASGGGSKPSFGISSRSPEPGAASGGTGESSSWTRSRPGSSSDRQENKFDEDDLPFALDKSDFNAIDRPGKGSSS